MVINKFQRDLVNVALRPATIVAAVCLTLGVMLIVDPILLSKIENLTAPQKWAYLLLSIGSIAYIYVLVTGVIDRLKMRSFSEIDERARKESMEVSSWHSIANELRESSKSESFDPEKLVEVISRNVSRAEKSAPAIDYKEYSISLVRLLEEKARLSDEKASALLDKGTFYVWVGIIFYLLSIVVWQLIIANVGFKTEFIYGMASCTFLFLFIEFLSAWFLKQYRHFIDTSTYLLKVKAIYDRYHLLFLAVAGDEKDISRDESKSKLLSKALTDEFLWPNDSHLNRADVAFAKEALISLSSLLKATRTKNRQGE